MNLPELRRVAELTSGKLLTIANIDELMQALPEPQKVPLDTDPPKPVWNTWPVLFLFLILLVTEWVLRKRRQMV